MKKVKAFFFSVHRIFGTIVCVFFFMWFVSGLVLIYHPFPNVTGQQLRERMEPLPSSLPDVEAVLARLPEPASNVEAVSVRQFQGQTLFTIETEDSTYVRCADTLQTVRPVTVKRSTPSHDGGSMPSLCVLTRCINAISGSCTRAT